MTKKATDLNDFDICYVLLDNIIVDCKEIKALFKYENIEMVNRNKNRLKADIESIKASLREIELTFVKE